MDFYYDSVNMRYPVKGSVTAGVFTFSDTTNEIGVVIDDHNQVTTNFAGSTPQGFRIIAEKFEGSFIYDIDESVWDIDEYIYDIGTAGIGTATHLLIHRLDSTNAVNVEVWASDDSVTNYTKVFDSAIETGDVWSINTLDASTSKSYFVVQFTGTHDVDCGEIVLAQKITGLYRQDLQQTKKLIHFVNLKTNYEGGEFSNKDNDLKEDVNYPYGVLSETQKGYLNSLDTGVYGQGKSFLMVKDSVRKWGKLKQNISFNEIAYEYYSSNLSMRFAT